MFLTNFDSYKNISYDQWNSNFKFLNIKTAEKFAMTYLYNTNYNGSIMLANTFYDKFIKFYFEDNKIPNNLTYFEINHLIASKIISIIGIENELCLQPIIWKLVEQSKPEVDFIIKVNNKIFNISKCIDGNCYYDDGKKKVHKHLFIEIIQHWNPSFEYLNTHVLNRLFISQEEYNQKLSQNGNYEKYYLKVNDYYFNQQNFDLPTFYKTFYDVFVKTNDFEVISGKPVFVALLRKYKNKTGLEIEVQKEDYESTSLFENKQSDKYNNIFLKDSSIDEILNILERNKNIIIKGQPGTGKTRNIKEILLKNNFNVDYAIQFSANYEYDDFVEGYRPKNNGESGFELHDGILKQCVNEALHNPTQKYAIIIDEINRGNVSSILGEAFTLIEYSKRSERHAIKLQQSKENFYIPKNVYVVGTMNTLDKTLYEFDFALKRRFEWFEFKPLFNSKLIQYALNQNIVEEEINHACNSFKLLNEKILKITNDKSYCLGHSDLVKVIKQDSNNFSENYNSLLETSIRDRLIDYNLIFENSFNNIDEIIENAKWK